MCIVTVGTVGMLQLLPRLRFMILEAIQLHGLQKNKSYWNKRCAHIPPVSQIAGTRLLSVYLAELKRTV